MSPEEAEKKYGELSDAIDVLEERIEAHYETMDELEDIFMAHKLEESE